MKRLPVLSVASPAVWNVLMSPVRAEILETLRLLGPATIAEVAAALDRPADTLYRHFQVLQEAGAVRDAGFRKGSRNVEQLFDVVAEDFMIDFHDNSGAAENKAVVATVNSFTKAVARAVRDSASARQLQFAPHERNLTISYELGRLTPQAFQKVRELVRQLKKIMDAGKQQPEGRLYMTLVVATPVTRKRGAGARGQAKSSFTKSTKIKENLHDK